MSLKDLSLLYFDYRGEITDQYLKKIVNMPIWDIKQCEVCKKTIVLPYGAPVYFHIDHFPQGKYISLIDKPITLKNIMKNFRIDKVYMVDNDELSLIKKIITI